MGVKNKASATVKMPCQQPALVRLIGWSLLGDGCVGIE